MPQRRILVCSDMDAWIASPAYSIIRLFILRVNGAVQTIKISSALYSPVHKPTIIMEPSLTDWRGKVIEELLKLLEHIDSIRTRHTALPMPSQRRYGNPAFRTFYCDLTNNAEDFVRKMLNVLETGETTIDNEGRKELEQELIAYLLSSFGNPVRLDYGTGHELSFVGFLCCLQQAGLLENPQDYTSLGLLVFGRYLDLARQIQLSYSLEPAGSHGVWGLDDYQFLPFVWGSAQLIGHEEDLPPSCITDHILVKTHSHDYLYLQCIEFITSIKKGRHFGEHSPLLHDISAVPRWQRVNTGLLNMYRDEVMGKFPVVQHFEFGRLLPFK